MHDTIRTEADLESLLGQYETLRLEFKSARLLEPQADKNKVVQDLSKEVSAFANTEGGILIVGIETGKEAEKVKAVASSETGVDPNCWKPERLQQMVAANISPPLNGLVVRPIALSGASKGRVAYVIEVPKGETAHQSTKDFIYYGRHEFQAVPLSDNIVRLLMSRGRAAHSVIELESIDWRVGGSRESPLEVESATGNMWTHWQSLPKQSATGSSRVYYLGLRIRNDGPLSIKQCLLAVTLNVHHTTTGKKWKHWSALETEKLEFPMALETRVWSDSHSESGDRRFEQKLYPGQVRPYPGAQFVVYVSAGADEWNARLDWVLYLDDTPPVSGSIDLQQAIKDHQKGQAE